MSCEKVKKVIPQYIKHIANEDDTAMVEEHLCVCNDCREYLSSYMDNPTTEIDHPTELPTQQEKIDQPTLEIKEETEVIRQFGSQILGSSDEEPEVDDLDDLDDLQLTLEPDESLPLQEPVLEPIKGFTRELDPIGGEPRMDDFQQDTPSILDDEEAETADLTLSEEPTEEEPEEYLVEEKIRDEVPSKRLKERVKKEPDPQEDTLNKKKIGVFEYAIVALALIAMFFVIVLLVSPK